MGKKGLKGRILGFWGICSGDVTNHFSRFDGLKHHNAPDKDYE